MLQQSLFATDGLAPSASKPNWRPAEPFSLATEHVVFLDCETTGLAWWAQDRPCGIAVALEDGRSRYLPFHHAGGNLEEDKVRDWARAELRNKTVIAFNAPFDINMMYAWGVDLEAQGCTVSDVGNYVALLDDRRRSYTLDSAARDYLGVGKVEGLNVAHIAEYHASEAEPYALRDVVLLYRLRELLLPKIEAEELGRVRQLEDDCLYVTCEMMRNGTPIDEAKLDTWIKRCREEYVACLWTLHKETGLRINPRSHPDLVDLFLKCGVTLPLNPEPGPDFGKVSFTKDALRAIDHPVIRVLYRARRLASLDSKYLAKYKEQIQRTGVLRYSLHQMPVEDEGGTISGRYSSSSFGAGLDGVNIQQVGGKKFDASMTGDPELEGFAIRELFIPESGLWGTADAEQIEYRLFAHFAKPPRVLEAYAKDPRTDFHNLVMDDMIRPIKADITRPLTKDLNFAKIFGAQLARVARMLRLTEQEAQPFVRAYDRAFPEAERLLKTAARLAERRGYVRTLLGRRARFAPEEPTYSALNRVIQGTAADEMKLKLVELHRHRKETGFKLRFTVHDEVNGDVPDVEAAQKVKEILNRQILETRVPLFWAVGVGPNWKQCEKI